HLGHVRAVYAGAKAHPRFTVYQRFDAVDTCNAAAPADDGQDLWMFAVIGLRIQIKEDMFMFRSWSGRATYLRQALLDLAGTQADEYTLESAHRSGQAP